MCIVKRKALELPTPLSLSSLQDLEVSAVFIRPDGLIIGIGGDAVKIQKEMLRWTFLRNWSG